MQQSRDNGNKQHLGAGGCGKCDGGPSTLRWRLRDCCSQPAVALPTVDDRPACRRRPPPRVQRRPRHRPPAPPLDSLTSCPTSGSACTTWQGDTMRHRRGSPASSPTIPAGMDPAIKRNPRSPSPRLMYPGSTNNLRSTSDSISASLGLTPAESCMYRCNYRSAWPPSSVDCRFGQVGRVTVKPSWLAAAAIRSS
jgi:hypothetical protein